MCCTFCFENPGSTTKTIPSIVREVSAIFVLTTTFLPKRGAIEKRKERRLMISELLGMLLKVRMVVSYIIGQAHRSVGEWWRYGRCNRVVKITCVKRCVKKGGGGGWDGLGPRKRERGDWRREVR